jgi:bifunctional non-homologous end joining protein LigD
VATRLNRVALLFSRACRLPLPMGFIKPCLPTTAPCPPSDETWLHEIKHDGFRVTTRKFEGSASLQGANLMH